MNDGLINTYVIVRDRIEELIEVLKTYQEKYRDSPKEFYYKLRDDEEFSDSKDCIIRASRFITLNRTCYNAIMDYTEKIDTVSLMFLGVNTRIQKFVIVII